MAKGELMKRALRVAGLGALGLIVTGCIELGAAPGGIEAPTELDSGIKNLVIFRRPAFFLDEKPVVLTLDGLDIAKIRIYEFVEIGLPEGPHVLGARCSESERPLTRQWRLVEHQFSIESVEEPQFIELGPCLFKDKTEAEAEQVLMDYTRRPLKDGVSVRLRDWLAEQRRNMASGS